MSAQVAYGSPHALDEIQSRIARAREILRDEELALQGLGERLDATFSMAVDKLLACKGNVVVSGMGKAGIVGQKLSASLASTGTPSHFLHPAEAVHGDLGRVRPEDCVLFLSASGETEEVVRLIKPLSDRVSETLAITCRQGSTLATGVGLALVIGDYREACSHGLAPSTSTTLMMALGDALALVASDCRGFTSQQFARFHPAGSLGKRLTDVKQLMRPIGQCRVAGAKLSVREVIVQVSRPGRRTGAIMLTGENGRLVGIFTDSDLARLLEKGGVADHGDAVLDQPVSAVMSNEFQTVGEDCLFPEAVRLLTEYKISELPVIDGAQRPLGVIDITDVLDPALLQAGSVMTSPAVAERPTPQERLPEDRASARPAPGPRILPLRAYRPEQVRRMREP